MLDIPCFLNFRAGAIGCPILFGKAFDVRYCPRQSYRMFRIKFHDITVQRLRRVALGVKGDKKNARACASFPSSRITCARRAIETGHSAVQCVNPKYISSR